MSGPRLFAPAPGRQLAAVRVLVVGFSLAWLVGGAPLLLSCLWFPAARFAPVGVVSALDAPLAPALGVAVWAASVIAGVAALLGARYRLSAPVFALGLLWVTSYRSSWGMIFHTENLMVLHALILAFLPAADAWSLDAKLRHGGLEWLDGEALLSHVAWDNLRKLELGSVHSPLGAWLCQFPALFAPLAWGSLALELGAPLALLGPRLARVFALGLWSFHLGVLALMAIAFPYPLVGVAFAPLLRAERPLEALAGWMSRRRARWRGRDEGRALVDER